MRLLKMFRTEKRKMRVSPCESQAMECSWVQMNDTKQLPNINGKLQK